MAGGSAGQIIDGRFELLERLGSGGMGTVWRARDSALHREVALKEVRPVDPALTPEDSDAARMLRERVLREAQALARVSHRNVVTVHHIVDQGPYPWIVMELLPGPSLQERLTDGPLTPQEAARTGQQVLGALRAAHAAGIQHRDVKPANVLLRADGSAVLTDFGIAALQGSASLTVTGELVGSPEYMAPERIRGADDDPASDLWSLGLTLYVCTEGHNPLRRGTGLATLAAVLDDPVPPPVRSGELTPVLNALLVRDVAARPGAEQLERMLTDVAEGRTAAAYEATETAMPPPVLPPRGQAQSQQPPAPQGPPPPGPVPPGDETPRQTAPRLPYGAAAGAYGSPGAYGPGAPGSPTPPPGGTQHGTRHGLRRGLLIAGAAVAVALLVGGSAYLMSSGDDGGAEADGKGDSASQAPADESPTRSPGPSGSPSPLDTPTPSGPGTPTTDGPEPPTSKAPVPQRPSENTWIAQLGSVPKSDGVAARNKQQQALNAKVSGVRWLDSDNFASLRPGYWMFYRPGPDATASGAFTDGNAAADWCASQALTSSNACVGRYLSDERADRVYICAPDQSKGTGRCTRPD
ncbi:serine/threonine protein kinase [Streptomyces armeniacus]|uniref:non-specific serine/threonine protein kinase n=1 Tax=Streptomyces armeniacus TaxID=83291 RepID=A0A345XLZ5_9ACTN|nr:serine/threonine-protein kinase [Streptomyces armeniacus]AXK32661.1 serine/threonine protein kinase [Streptomyces armeniacus]